MKEGLIAEDGEWRYYKDGELYHAGAIKLGDDIYYINSHGRAVTGRYAVHTAMANGILKRGVYTFGEDGRLVKGSYRSPKSRKRHSRRKTKIRLNGAQLSAIGGVVVTVTILLVGLWIGFSKDEPPAPPVTPGGQTTQTPQTVAMPTFEQEICLCSDFALQVYNGEADIADAAQNGNPYRPFVFSYRLNDVSGVLQICEHADMSDCREFVLDQAETVLNIDNLKTDTTYYYCATVDGKEYSGSFRTAPSNRFLSFPSLENVRDIGGYRTENGKTVKQGMIIRGPEADGLVNTDYFIPADAVPAIQDTFGFVYELDLRASNIYAGIYRSRFGEEVGHRFYGAPSYVEIFKPEYLEAVKAVFADLAQPANYPMYLHCTWGADRTGTIVFLLQGVLGVSEEDMIEEYKLTGYAIPSVLDGANLDKLIWGLQSYEGDTLQEKIVSYLTQTAGVTQQELAAIRGILLEE